MYNENRIQIVDLNYTPNESVKKNDMYFGAVQRHILHLIIRKVMLIYQCFCETSYQ